MLLIIKNFFLFKIRTKITFLYADKANLNNLGPNYYKSNQEFSYIVSNGTVIKELLQISRLILLEIIKLAQAVIKSIKKII